MSKETWRCSGDDHINKRDIIECEICGEKRPSFKVLEFQLTDIFGKVKINWEYENASDANLLIKKEKITVDLTEGGINLENIKNKEVLEFILRNDIATHSEYLKITLNKPEILIFNSDLDKVLENANFNINWQVNNAQSVYISNIGDVSSKGRITLNTPKNHYKITAKNSIGKAEKELSFEILPPPEVKEFRFDKKKLKRGEFTRLIWDVKNIISADLIYNGRRKKIQTWGSMKITPKRHTEYVLELTALDETTIIRQAQKIEVFEKGSIKKFAVDSHYFLPITPLTLVWEVYHSKKVVLEGFGEVKPVDSLVVRPKKDTLYKLIVEDEFGVFEEVVQVKEMPMPKIESIAAPAPSSFSLPRIHLSTPLYPILQSAPKAIHSGIELNTKNIKLDFLISFETIAAKFLSENLFKKPTFHFNINAVQNAFSSLKQKIKL